MKFVNTLVIMLVFFALSYVAGYTLVVENELDRFRQARINNTEELEAITQATEALEFARNSQYVAVMAEERASELSYKLNVVASIMASLEEQLLQAELIIEEQSEQIQDLVDQNNELQDINAFMADKLLYMEEHLDNLLLELEATKAKLKKCQDKKIVNPFVEDTT